MTKQVKRASKKAPPMAHRIKWAAGAIEVAGTGADIHKLVSVLRVGGHNVLDWDGMSAAVRAEHSACESLRYVLRKAKMTIDGRKMRRFHHTAIPVEGSPTGEKVECWVDYGRMLIEKTRDPISRQRVIEQITLTRNQIDEVIKRQQARIDGWDYALQAIQSGTVFQPVLLHIEEEAAV